jgi:hypothetical protein
MELRGISRKLQLLLKLEDFEEAAGNSDILAVSVPLLETGTKRVDRLKIDVAIHHDELGTISRRAVVRSEP